MRWNYQCHTALSWVLYWPQTVLRWIEGVSWEYAHYRSPKFRADHIYLLRLEKSFFKVLAREWYNARADWE